MPWVLVLLAACSEERATTDTAAAALAPPALAPPAAPAAPEPAPTRVRVPGGTFLSGTEPERFERQARLEPRTSRTALGPFEVDVEPYPGRGQRPLLGLSRDQAADRCADRGGRLCTELEWERACKGPESHPFATGDQLVEPCETPRQCASGFGVYGMGRLLEWTASELTSPRALLARGAGEGAPAALRRCAHREPKSDAPAPGVAFRCCYGPPNAARVVLPRLGRAFERVVLADDELAEWLASEPKTARLAHALSRFSEPDGPRAVLARGGASPQPGVTTSAVRWNPAAGVELIVVAARSGAATSFVAVLDALPDGRRRVAASFVLEGEPGPVALGYDAAARDRMRFGTCWGCLGEMGRLLYREPDRVLIVQP